MPGLNRDQLARMCDAVGSFMGVACVAISDNNVDPKTLEKADALVRSLIGKNFPRKDGELAEGTWANCRALMRETALEIVKMIDQAEGRN